MGVFHSIKWSKVLVNRHILDKVDKSKIIRWKLSKDIAVFICVGRIQIEAETREDDLHYE